MSFVVIYRDSQGVASILNKLFSTEEDAYTFVKSHSISEFEIITDSELQQYLAEQQQRQQTGNQRQGGYQQRVTAYSDEREPQTRRDYSQPYKPDFFKPTFVGKKQRRG
jgi:hypothetical protein